MPFYTSEHMRKQLFGLTMIVALGLSACGASGNESSTVTEQSTTDRSVPGEKVESPTTASSSAASPGMGGAVNTHEAAADTTEHSIE